MGLLNPTHGQMMHHQYAQGLYTRLLEQTYMPSFQRPKPPGLARV
ncbi:MAG: hypothetical protein Ct9H300mP21_00140 [Pseudomonadota bacterium]|nr:MAG: hypothetical protein Ct9H300mP21_00140 [Pseudomonadota bacterium]